MGPSISSETSAVAIATFAIAVLLAGLAVYNYVTGVHGGAIVSSIGAIVATLFGLLVD